MTTTTASGRAFPPYTPPAPPPSIRPAPRARRVYPAWLLPAVIGAIVLAVAVLTISPWPVGVYYDDAIYLILGKSLATGEGYRYLNLPGTPAATHYPPGYPAVLALLWSIAPSFPENVAVFKLANAVLLALAAAGLYLFARRDLELSGAGAAGAILLGCLTVPVLAVTGVLFSEPLFLALLAVALPAGERALRDDRTRTVIAAALLGAAATLVRSIGLPLVGALVLLLLLRERYRHAAIAAGVAAALLLPWHLWTALHAGNLPSAVAGSYGSYTGAIVDAIDAKGIGFLGRVAVHNLQDLARPIGAIFAPGLNATLRALAVLATIGLLTVGGSVLAKRAPLTALFLVGYAAIVVIWPYAPDRFLWGIWPLVVVTLALGASVGARAARERRATGIPLVGHAALVVAAGALAVGLVRYNARGFQEQWWDAAQRVIARQLLPLVEWTERHTRHDDVIASDGDPLLHLYTGRQAVPSARWAVEAYPGGADSVTAIADLQSILGAYPARYLLLSSNRSPTARATRELRAGPTPSLELINVLPSGGAAFVVFRPSNDR